jgi:hypothetical protein
MFGINGFQPPISPDGRHQVSPGGVVEQVGGERSTGLGVDTYSGDREVLRNRAQTLAGDTACRCGNCPACAAKAYQTQEQQLESKPQTAIGEQGEIEGGAEAIK